MARQSTPQSTGGAYPPVVLRYLHRAGWTPDRVIGTSPYKVAYEREGFQFATKVKGFLRRFGGLIIKYEISRHREDVLEFLADRAVQGMGDGVVKAFENLIGENQLFPIGHYLFGTCMLLMDESGQVFGGSDATISLIGKTGEEAIVNVLTGSGVTILEERLTDRSPPKKRSRSRGTA